MLTQDDWRFCTKCYGLFWWGYPTKGTCPNGGAHSPLQEDSPRKVTGSWDYELESESQDPPPGPGTGAGASAPGYQGNWRFCTKCYVLFWWGYETSGQCPSGGEHSPLQQDSPTNAATSWNFQLKAESEDPPPGPGTGAGESSPGYQGNWRFCTKCYVLFWWGYETSGQCPSGGEHSPLQQDSPTNAATSWNFGLKVVSEIPFGEAELGRKPGSPAQVD